MAAGKMQSVFVKRSLSFCGCDSTGIATKKSALQPSLCWQYHHNSSTRM